MATLELTIDPRYCPSMNIYDCVRELVQNAKDGDTAGYPMVIKYSKNRTQPTLQLKNVGAQLEKNSLLMGGTTKRDNPNMIGTHGDGLKVAFLTLLRQGLTVWIRTGYETWIPEISYSEVYKSDLLKVKVTKSQMYDSDLTVEVRGLVESDWLAIKERFLFEPFVKLEENEQIELGRSKILTDKKYQGHLFVKGIWVGMLPGQYHYGYDMSDLKLDRDRKLADPWDLKYAIKNLLNDAAQQNKISASDLYSLLQMDATEESRVILDHCDYGCSDIAAKIVSEFKSLHGVEADTLPVESMQQSMDAKHHGFKGIVVPKTIKRLIETQQGTFETKKQTKVFEALKRYGVDDLSPEETENFLWATNLLKLIEREEPVMVVDFFGEKVLGLFNNGEISVAKKILVDRKELVATMVHEVAHHAGDDGTILHEREIESLFAKIVVECTKNK